jgi:hypothetical protein
MAAEGSRAVLAWRLSNTMDVGFCVSALEEALARFGRPEIFNTDQVSQFTSAAFTGVLASARIRISMDGRGRWMDNVFIERLWRSLKHEDVYLKGYADRQEAKVGIAEWVRFYNNLRPHQALGDRTRMAVWREVRGSPARSARGLWISGVINVAMRTVSSPGKSSRKRSAICCGLHAIAHRRFCCRPCRRPFHGTTGPGDATPPKAGRTHPIRTDPARRLGCTSVANHKKEQRRPPERPRPPARLSTPRLSTRRHSIGRSATSRTRQPDHAERRRVRRRL